MDPVTQSLFALQDRIERYGANRRTDELALQDIGLQKARFGMQQNIAQGQQDVELAKAKREQWLSEPVTIGQAIDTHPRWTDEEKQSIKASIPEDMRDSFLNHITTRGQLNNAMSQLQKNYSDTQQKELDRASKEREGRLNRQSAERIAGMRTTGKPGQELSQMKLDAWKAYMENNASPEQERLIGVDKDQFLSHAARIVSQDYNMFDKSPEEVVRRISDIADQLRAGRQQNPKAEVQTSGKVDMTYDKKTNRLIAN